MASKRTPAKSPSARRKVQPAARQVRKPRAGVARHVDELYTQGLAVAKRYREQALVNEAYVHGDQWDVIITAGGQPSVRKDAWYDDEEIPRISVNEIGPTHQTWSALMTKTRPTVTAAEANESPEAAYKAAVGNVVIDFLEGELDSANNVHKATSFAGMHGTGGMKVCFVEKEDKVTWSRLTIFDFVIDPRHADYRKAAWVIFEDHIDEDEALDAYEQNGIERKPDLTPYKNAAGDELSGVRRLEFWHRPCRKYPQGKFACLIDGEVVEDRDEYPYVFEDDSGELQHPLPLVLMRVRDIRDGVYGGTNLSAAVPMQHGYNEMVSRIQKEIRDRKTHLFLPDSVEDTYLAGTTVVFFPAKDYEGAREARYLVAGDPPKALFDQRDFFRTAIPTVMGLNEVTAGTESRTLSGRAIENIVELDEQKNADATKELQAMVQDAWELTWRLVGHFYTEMRIAEIAGASAEDVFAFNSTDVQGKDVKLEPASELDKLSTAKKLATAEGVQTGADTPLDLQRARGGGSVGFARQQSEQIIDEYLQGLPLDAAPDDLNLQVFEQVIQKRMTRALAKRDRATWIQLEQLRRQMRDMGPAADDLQPRAPAGEGEEQQLDA